MKFDLSLQQYVEWEVKNVMPIKGKYGYRVILKYMDGSERPQQKSGFATEKEANAARDKTIGELYAGTYVVYSNVSVKDFLEFWIEEDIRNRVGSAETYDIYRGIVKNHIIPHWGKRKMTDINRGDVVKLYKEKTEYSPSTARLLKTVMNVSMKYAVDKFEDSDYICCSVTGRAKSKDFHWSHYKKLLEENHLPNIRWHDLRSTFCTLLLKNDFNPKAVSKLMGHAKEIITMDVYGDNRGIIADCVDEIQPFIDEVLPTEDLDSELQTEVWP